MFLCVCVCVTQCVVVGVDPHGSILALPDELNSEGVGTYKVRCRGG